jgi:hypothetical protein
MNVPHLSIVINNYNYARYLPRRWTASCARCSQVMN